MEPVFCNVFFVKCSESANKDESINQSKSTLHNRPY